MNHFLKLIFSIIICQLAGAAGLFFNSGSEDVWYSSLAKPSFTPPDWVFAPVWIILYLLIGISLFLVWKEDLKNSKVKSAFIVFIVQLFLNSLWTPIFFGAESVLGGLIVIVILWIMIIFTFIKFKSVSKTAASLLIPYFLWVSFAAMLNLSLYLLNK